MRAEFFTEDERRALYDHLCDDHDHPADAGEAEGGPDAGLVGWHARYHGARDVAPGHFTLYADNVWPDDPEPDEDMTDDEGCCSRCGMFPSRCSCPAVRA